MNAAGTNTAAPDLTTAGPATPAGPAGGDRGAVTELIMRTFQLNGIFLTVGESLSRPAGLTSARWQVLGAVLRSPLSVAGIARHMGLTRQSVQRIANVLVDDGLAAYLDNPAHRRAKLLTPTDAGRAAIRRIAPTQHAWAQALTDRVGEAQLRQALKTLDAVIAALGPLPAPLDEPGA